MTNDSTYWTNLAAQQLGHTAAAPDLREPEEPLPLVMASDASAAAPAPGAPPPPVDDPTHRTGVALHPRLHLALDQLLDAEGGQTHNLAILVGRLRRVPARRRADETRPRAEAAAGRYQITDYGVREDLFRLEIQQAASAALDSALT